MYFYIRNFVLFSSILLFIPIIVCSFNINYIQGRHSGVWQGVHCYPCFICNLIHCPKIYKRANDRKVIKNTFWFLLVQMKIQFQKISLKNFTSRKKKKKIDDIKLDDSKTIAFLNFDIPIKKRTVSLILYNIILWTQWYDTNQQSR